jgi:putative DNA primase/helicase
MSKTSKNAPSRAEILSEIEGFFSKNGFRLDKKTIKEGIGRLFYGDEKRSSCRYMLTINDNGTGFATYGGEKIGGWKTWQSKSVKGLSDSERKAIKEQLEKRLEEAAKEDAVRHERIASRLTRVVRRYPKAEGSHPYLLKKGIEQRGAYLRGKDNSLLIPMYDITDPDGKIWNIQRIWPNGFKAFWPGAKVKGGYYAFPGDKSVILICEGYATGESVNRATGYATVCAMNTGNLLPVAKGVREKYPDARIVFCADNDAWVFKAGKVPKDVKREDYKGNDPMWRVWEDEGRLDNPGRRFAEQAAASIGGAVLVWPEFDPDREDKPTDFNDLMAIQGLEAVKERIMEVINSTPEKVEDKPTMMDVPDPVYSESTDSFYVQQGGDNSIEQPFTILGHNDGTYYFLPKAGGQIVGLHVSAMGNISNLFRLAPLSYWLDQTDDSKITHRKLAEMMANYLSSACHAKGVFRPHNIKGIGMWKDDKRFVMHLGAKLLVDGDYMVPHTFKGKNVYPLRQSTFSIGLEPLSNKEANKLRQYTSRISWESPLSGDLVAGWCVIAPICACLPWRPHIWVTGQSQAGKSTVLKKIIRPTVGEIGLYLEGGTTEAALRQMIGCDGRPIIIDESESETNKDKAITENIMQLARRSSSGGIVVKGTAGGEAVEYNVQSAFCFSAINTAIRHRADQSRISVMNVVKDDREGAVERYKQLERDLAADITPEYGQRLLARTVRNIDNIIHNCTVFINAAAEVLRDKRAADQIAPMLAGLFSLTSTNKIAHDKAVEWIKTQSWKLHTAVEENTDPERLVTFIATRLLRFAPGHGLSREESIGRLIERVIKDSDHDAELLLRSYGIWPRDGFVWVANSSPLLESLLKDTQWISWKRPLGDIKGAEKKDPIKFSPGLSSRSVAVPIEIFNI